MFYIPFGLGLKRKEPSYIRSMRDYWEETDALIQMINEKNTRSMKSKPSKDKAKRPSPLFLTRHVSSTQEIFL
jgi:hypothetical protein